MVLAIYEIMGRLKVDEKTFFRMAHMRLFGRDVDVSTDVLAFKQSHGVVTPKYVENYTQQLMDELI